MRRSLPGTLALLLAVPGTGAARSLSVEGPVETAFHVRRAVRGAARLLERPECARVLSDFADRAGRSLQAVLDTRGERGHEYVQGLRYEGPPPFSPCRKREVLAFTRPGADVVFVCTQFTSVARANPPLAQSILIHEMLHTLGLGEDPPTTYEITRQVERRCAH
ncbi:MAG TPA: hypothetical protein VII13_19395 [Vicinamibacteria bacterium]|jgi:hypothetical protein